MSVIFESSNGYILCHKTFLEQLYRAVHKEDSVIRFNPHEHLFLITTPYMKDGEAQKKVKDISALNPQEPQSLKRKFGAEFSKDLSESKICQVRKAYEDLLKEARSRGCFSFVSSQQDILNNNRDARNLSESLYKVSSFEKSIPFNGENSTNQSLLQIFGSEMYIFPQNCKFFNRNVFEMKECMDSLGKFDLIVLDPPWWNKYIRRKKAKCQQEGYKMMYNENLGELPIGNILAPGGIIAVWCTNARSNLEDLKLKVFPLWGVQQVAQWMWVKVTLSGEPVCPFSEPPGKQPFEQLIFGVRPDEVNIFPRPDDDRIFISVPSAVHSHKPPISEMMQRYLPNNPRCLEIFARYLLPNWTSWGLEVLKLQHHSLYQEV